MESIESMVEQRRTNKSKNEEAVSSAGRKYDMFN